MHIQESGEMYLETIFVLSKEHSNVRSIDIAEHLSYSKPSVSRAMGILKTGGYITMDALGSIHLTEEGEKIAAKIYERHTLITTFLEALGVDKETAAEDACKMEHVLSDKSFNAIKDHVANHLK